MASHEHPEPHGPDAGYGPTPEGAQHEHTDINPGIGYQFAIWLTVAMLISGGIVYGTFLALGNITTENEAATQQFPLAAGQQQVPPQPRLQTQPFKDVYLLRETENQRLASYGWVAQATGTVRIPIDEAMRLTIERGLPVRPGASPEGLNMVVQDSSSGRTAAPRD
jgi:hypothetical protein